MSNIKVIDRNCLIPTLKEALSLAETGIVTDFIISMTVDGEVVNIMTESDSPYTDVGILFDLALERLGYWPREIEEV